MFVSETSSYEILKIIGKLKNKYSAGLDEFSGLFVKDVRSHHYTPV